MICDNCSKDFPKFDLNNVLVINENLEKIIKVCPFCLEKIDSKQLFSSITKKGDEIIVSFSRESRNS